MSTAVDSIRAAAQAKVAESAPAVSQEQTILNLQAQLAAAMQKITELVPKAPEPVGMKRYYSRTPFCNFYVMRSPGYCTQHQFIAGAFETDDPVIQKHLDEICGQQDAAVSKQNIFGHVREEEVKMHQDLASVASRSHGRMIAAGEATG